MNNLGFSENELLEQIEPVCRQISFEISESMQSGCEIIQFILEELDGMSMSITVSYTHLKLPTILLV